MDVRLDSTKPYINQVVTDYMFSFDDKLDFFNSIEKYKKRFRS